MSEGGHLLFHLARRKRPIIVGTMVARAPEHEHYLLPSW
jgi:hypothetical protein